MLNVITYLYTFNIIIALNVKFNTYLFSKEPNPEDPLNKEAAEVLQNNRRVFEQNVRKAMSGGYVGSTYFERCLK